MHPYNLNPNPEVLRWLATAEKFLNGRDLVGSKALATRVRETDPTIEEAEQILAIVDTLIAGEKQVSNQNLDWYAILQLARRTHDSELIASQYRRLSKMLNPNRNKFAFADHAFKLIGDAWSVLSNPSRKFQFDNEFGNSSNTHFNFLQQHYETPLQPAQHHQQNNSSTHFNFIQEHSEQLHQSAPMQQQFLPQFGQQQLFPPQPLQFMNEEQQAHRQVFPQQLHWSNQTRQSLLTPQPQQPQPEQHWPQPQPQPQQSFPRSQPQPQQSLPQPQQSLPQPQPQQSLPQPQLQHSLPLSQPQIQQPFPWLQPDTQSQPQHQPSLFSIPQPEIRPQLQHQPSPFSVPQPQPQPQTQLQQPLPAYEAQPPSSEPQPQPEPQSQPEKPPSQSREGVGNNVQFNLGENGGNDDNRENVDKSTNFWTACPYCYYMYEYPSIYVDCSLRCQNCKKAIHAVRLAAPPEVAEGDDVYIACWGFFPIGVSASYFEKDKAGDSSWTPFSTMHTFPRVGNAAKPKNVRNSGPRVYIDDEDQDIFQDISSNEESDEDWQKVERSLKRKFSTANKVNQPQVYKGERITRNKLGESSGVVAQKEVGVSVPNREVPNMPNATVPSVPNGGIPSVPNATVPSVPNTAVPSISNAAVPSVAVDGTNEKVAGVTKKKVGRPSKKGVSVSTRKQPGRAAKDLGNQM